FHHAQQLSDRTVASLRPEDESVPADLPALLLDLQRPAEALSYLTKQRERRPKDPAVLADLVRAFAGLGDTAQALQVAEELARSEAARVADGLALADTLFQSGHDLVASAVYSQVLAKEPGNVVAQIGMARVAIYQHLPQQACKLLEGIKPGDAERRRLQLAWG